VKTHAKKKKKNKKKEKKEKKEKRGKKKHERKRIKGIVNSFPYIHCGEYHAIWG